MIGKEISTPGTADVTVIRLIVVVLVTVTEALYPCVVAIVLRGRPVPRSKANNLSFDDDLMVNTADCSAMLPSTPARADISALVTIPFEIVTAVIRDEHAHRAGPWPQPVLAISFPNS